MALLKPLTYTLRDADFAKAITFLKSGELLAFPTETVYGLGASIFNEQAIQKIFQIKGRPQDNPLIAHIHSLEEAHAIAIDIPDEFFLLTQHFFPGPLTVVLKKHPSVPSIVSAGGQTIALRMPQHPAALALIQAMGTPLVAPSANLSGKPSATTAQHVLDDFSENVSVLDGGPCAYGLESTVISLCHPQPTILRPGAITQRQLEEALNVPVNLANKIGESEAVASPGMKYRHYSPKAKVKLFSHWSELIAYIGDFSNLKRKILCHPLSEVARYGLPLTPHLLYAHFRDADREDCQEILILCDNFVISDLALYNRLVKAAE